MAVFNRFEKETDIQVDLASLNLTDAYKVRDLWRCADEAPAKGKLSMHLGRHGVKFVKLSSITQAGM
jgi:hypothetical protein